MRFALCDKGTILMQDASTARANEVRRYHSPAATHSAHIQTAQSALTVIARIPSALYCIFAPRATRLGVCMCSGLRASERV
jgi:hypothetical protein